jgi:plastocyanin
MSENLDSRALRHTDCYGQRFMKPGTYAYALVPAGGAGASSDHPYVVEVVEKSAKREGDMHQQTVTVRFVKERHGDCCDERTSDPGRFVPDQDRVTVEAGDMVVWNSPDAATRPFAVDGEKEFFGSTDLTNECGYTHVFMTPGEHEYVDANGSGLRGVVRVADPKPGNLEELRAWQSRLGEGTLVMISEGRPEPAEVEIMLGQTVFFAIVKGSGVTITHASLGARDSKAAGAA